MVYIFYVITDSEREFIMKAELFVEFAGKQVAQDELVKNIKKIWTDAGNKASEIKSLNVYVQPDNNIAYYVINDDFKGEYIL